MQEIKIIYEDRQIIVCDKPAGMPSQSKDVQVKDVVSVMKNHLRQAEAEANPQEKGRTKHDHVAGEPYLALIHRLDQPVRGLLVFARTPYAAKELNQQLVRHRFGKHYLALVEGTPPEKSGVLEDYLVKDYLSNMTRVCGKDTPGAKLGRLSYQVLKEGQKDYILGQKFFNLEQAGPAPTMLHIRLETGRHHQIRAQLAHIGCPIIGDNKYNRAAVPGSQICLCAYKLTFDHPSTHKHMCFQLDENRT